MIDTLRLFQRKSYLKIYSSDPVSICVLRENIDDQKSYFYHLRSLLRGTWYYSYKRRVYTPGVGMVVSKVSDFSWLRKIRYSVVPFDTASRYKNVVTDCTRYVKDVLKRYSSRSPASIRSIKNIADSFIPGRKSILIYALDLSRETPRYDKCLIFPLLFWVFKDQEFKLLPFYPEVVIVHIIKGAKNLYVPIILGKDYSKQTLMRCLGFLRWVISQTSVPEDQIEKVIDEYDVSDPNLASKSIAMVAPSLVRRLNDTVDEEVIKAKVDESIKHMVQNTIPTLHKSIYSNVPKKEEIVKNVLDSLVYTIQPSKKSRFVPTDFIDKISLESDTSKRVDLQVLKKSQIAEREVVDHIITDLSSFSHIHDITIKDYSITQPYLYSEVSPTYLSTLTLQIEIEGKTHSLQIDIPRKTSEGYYLINGNKYIESKQLAPMPIVFPRPYESIFRSRIMVISMKTSPRSHCKVFIYGMNIPYTAFMCLVFGFEKVFDKYRIKYKISNETNVDKKYSQFRVSKDLYLWIEDYDKLDEIQKNLVISLVKFKGLDLIQETFPSEAYFIKFIDLYCNEVKNLELLKKSVMNCIDGHTYHILYNKSLPTNIFDVLVFMHEGVNSGVVTPRNNLRNMALNVNTLSQMCVDTIIQYIREYKFYKTRDQNYKLIIPKDIIVSRVITENVLEKMEDANPVEEMSFHDKVSFGGYRGLPKDSVSDILRLQNETYFGVIDPVDTPIGGTVGYVNHLSSNHILSADSTLVHRFDDTIGSGAMSVTTSLIPFLNQNEPTRLSMSCNQLRQAVPIYGSEPPIVRTGMESVIPRLLPSSTHVKLSPCEGKVDKIDQYSITIQCSSGERQKVDISEEVGSSGSGYHSSIIFQPSVRQGQKVVKNEILCDSSFIKSGSLSLGRMCLVAYMYYKGYTFEDGIVVSESIVDNFTSTHVIILKTFVSLEDKITKLNIVKNPTAGEVAVGVVGKKFHDLIEDEVIDTENVLVTGNSFTLIYPMSGEVTDYEVALCGNATYYDYTEDIIKVLKDLEAPTNMYFKGLSGLFIKIHLRVDMELTLGDKLTNRHASKGVICKIEKESDMPTLSDGRRVEVIMSPITYINRSNLGQLSELYLSEISYKLLNIAIKEGRNRLIDVSKKVLPVLLKDGDKYLSFLKNATDQQYDSFIKSCSRSVGIPFIVGVFNEPKLSVIYRCLKMLDIPVRQKVTLNDGTSIECIAGYQYILKLEHMSKTKIHARSIGTYKFATGQPVQGKRRGGGQRLGEESLFSLSTWSESLAEEMFSAGSDDILSKIDMYRSIVETGKCSIENVRKLTQTRTSKYIESLLKGIMIGGKDISEWRT